MKLKNICFILPLLLLLIHKVSFAQDIAFVPPVYNYNTSNYNGGNQNWAVAQDKSGIIYAANNRGLLSFDGVNWELHTLPNNIGVKSIFIDSSETENEITEKIYVGAFEEFGYFERDATNRLTYYSLKPLVKDYTFKNDEIWTIVKNDNTIYFQSFSSYFSYSENELITNVSRPSPLYFFSLTQ